MRWPLYPIEVVLCIVALLLCFLSVRKQTPGWRQVPIIVPWLVLKLIYGIAMSYLALQIHGDIQPNATIALWVNVIMIAGPLSVALLLAVRLWKHG